MKKLILTFITLFIFCSPFYAQAITKSDSLSKAQRKHSNKNEQLRETIDSLKMLRDSLQKKLREEQRELYIMKYGEEAGNKIALGQIWMGMTEEMMRDSWGEPDSITVNDQDWGRYSQWYYGEITYFFKDGELFEWEEND